MIKLTVPDMTCGGCVRSVEKAVKGVDASATVSADLASHVVSVETAAAQAVIAKAIADAGFTPTAA